MFDGSGYGSGLARVSSNVKCGERHSRSSKAWVSSMGRSCTFRLAIMGFHVELCCPARD